MKLYQTANGDLLIAFVDFYNERTSNDYVIFTWDGEQKFRASLIPKIQRFDHMVDDMKLTQDNFLIFVGTPEHRFLNQKEKCLKIVSLETGQQIVPDINRHGFNSILNPYDKGLIPYELSVNPGKNGTITERVCGKNPKRIIESFLICFCALDFFSRKHARSRSQN